MKKMKDKYESSSDACLVLKSPIVSSREYKATNL